MIVPIVAWSLLQKQSSFSHLVSFDLTTATPPRTECEINRGKEKGSHDRKL